MNPGAKVRSEIALGRGSRFRLAIALRIHRSWPEAQRIAARALDALVAVVLLTMCAPIILLRVSLALAATGKVFARIERVGTDGRALTIYRFAGDFAGRGLATPISLLTGDLTLVGPRPRTLREADGRSADPVLRSVTPGVISPHETRRSIGLDWESADHTEREFVYAQTAGSALGIALRTLVGRMLGGRPDRPCPPVVTFFGVPIRNTTMEETLQWIMERVAARQPSLLAFVNPDCLNNAWKNEAYRAVLKRAARVLPDGIGVHLGCRIQGTRLAANLNGTDLFPRLCRRAAEGDVSLFLMGARPGIAEAAAENMRSQIPRLRIVGTEHGYFDRSDSAKVIDKINRSGADILLVAMGAPQQELWLAEHADALTPSVRMGVGGLFDFYSGRIKRAPVWVREIGMEWVWRILMEPRRMWRRYVVGNPLFLARVLSESRPGRDRHQPIVSGSVRVRAIRQGAASLVRIGRRLALAGAATAKRCLDVVGAGAGLLVLSPLFAAVACCIRAESPGPVIFRQPRVGLGGRTFTMFKFRSMYTDAEARRASMLAKNEMPGGVLFKIKDDPRITRAGRLIRKASIDELPQLWNVLRGDMSLVGPRPPLPSEVAQYDLPDRRRLHVKPGITCIWQVTGRSDIPFERQVELDLDYIHSQSLVTDIKLLLQTVPAVVRGKGAY